MGKFFHAHSGTRRKWNGAPILAVTRSRSISDNAREDPIVIVTLRNGETIRAFTSEVKEGRND